MRSICNCSALPNNRRFLTGNPLLTLNALTRTTTLVLALSASFLTTACAPLLIGGAMLGGTLVATDHRTSGTQLEEEGIELKAAARVRDQLGDKAHVNINSYNRLALITGEVNNEADREKLTAIVSGVENVRTVLNETAVTMNSSLGNRSNDVLIATKVKASLVEARDLISNAFYVVVERGTVYLMGRVSEREAKRATDIARSVGGVNKVVRAFDVVSEEELARLTPKQAAK